MQTAQQNQTTWKSKNSLNARLMLLPSLGLISVLELSLGAREKKIDLELEKGWTVWQMYTKVVNPETAKDRYHQDEEGEEEKASSPVSLQ